MTPDEFGTLELPGFDPPPKPLPPMDNGVTRWRHWKGSHVACSHCVSECMAGARSVPSGATYVMTEKGVETYLCYEHAAVARHHH